MITIQTYITGADRVSADLERLAVQIPEAIAGALRSYGEELTSDIQEDKLSGQVLNARSGDLRASIRPLETALGDVMEGGSAGGAGIPYAHIHEYGGVIEARNAPYLTFKTADGMWHRVKSVVMPERSYMRSTFDETAEGGLQELRDAVRAAVEAA